MCLARNANASNEFKKLIKSKGGKITVYKYLVLTKNLALRSPYRSCQLDGSKPLPSWKVGVNTSNREEWIKIHQPTITNPSMLTDLEKITQTIHYGFHVYVNKQRPYPNPGFGPNNPILVPFQANLEDFVAASRESLSQDLYQEAVFTKLTLKKTKQKIIEQAKKAKTKKCASK